MGRSTHKLVEQGAQGNQLEDAGGLPEGFAQLLGAQQQDDSHRMIALYGEVNEHTISQVVLQMIHFANQSDAPIRLIISTYGGSVDEMFSLYDTIKFIKAPVHTVVLGKVMSAGILIASAGEKGHRMMGPTSRAMIHPISGGALGHIFDVENNVKEMKRIQEQMTKFLAIETGQSKKTITKMMESGKDSYLTAEEAVEFGIVDKIMKQE